MYEQYEKHKGICRQLKKVKPEKREQFREQHYAEFALYEAAVRLSGRSESCRDADCSEKVAE